MPRPALTDKQRLETRQLIRSAAAELFAKNGLKELTVRAVAKSAGVSIGTVYAHYRTLTELMQSLWKEPVKRLIENMTEIAQSTSVPLERLEKLLRFYVEFANTQRAVYRGAFLFVRPESHQKPKQVALGEDRLYSLFRDTVIECQLEGKLRQGDPDEITQNIWAAMHGALALPINVDRLAFAPSEVMAERMITMLLEWLRPD